MNQIIKTSDGSHTIYVKEIDEHYHSIHGAIMESDHIFIKNGFSFCQAEPVRIFEVGFGTGLNALLTLNESIKTHRSVEYTAIEKYPLDEQIVKHLNYSELIGDINRKLFNLLHDAPWNEFHNIDHNFKLRKIEGDFTARQFNEKYDIVYFDAFGPDKQPGMWTKEIFMKISEMTSENGIFITYSAKGEVKRNLMANGFRVTLLPGPPGKRQITRAIKMKEEFENEII